MTAGRHTFALTPDPAGLAAMSAWIADLGDRLGLRPDRLYALDLCATEAVTNVIDHGAVVDPNATIDLVLLTAPGSLQLRIEDSGRPFDPLTAAPPVAAASIDEAAIGGLGLHLVRNFVDRMCYARTNERNCLTLIWDEAEADTLRASA